MMITKALLPLFIAAMIVAAGARPRFAPAVTASARSQQDLSGLWKAKRSFGQVVGGQVLIERNGTSYSAELLGRRLPVHSERRELIVDLPNGLGSIRGKLDANHISGYWFRPRTPVSGETAIPLILKEDRPTRWIGELLPFQDEFTFYLLIRKRPDGSLGAVLRNPEFDYGRQRNVDRLIEEGSNLKLMGMWRGQEMPIATGSYDSETDVMTFVFPGRGGSYDFQRDTDESEFYPRGKNPGHYVYHTPPGLEDDWTTASLSDVDIDQPGIERFIQKVLEMPMDSNDAAQVHAILIARHGRLVLEEYFHGEYREKLHMTRSAAKSVTAVIVGAAIQAGAPLKLSSPVYQIMKGASCSSEVDQQKRRMTLEHLLTMSSGYFCDDTNEDAPGNEDKMWQQTDERDFYRYTLNVPLTTPPGKNAVYCGASPNLALGMLGRVTDEFPIYSFDRLVGRPMKINRYVWPLDPAGNPYGGGGVLFLARDFLKFGQLLLNRGTWGNRRILSREYVSKMTGRLYHLRRIYYGYLWWNEDYPYKNRKVQVIRAMGAGGQSITIIPELDVVVAMYAGNYSGRTQLDIQNMVARSILPTIREHGDNKNAPVIEQEFKGTYGASKDGSRVSEPR